MKYKICNHTDIYGSYKNMIHMLPSEYYSKFNFSKINKNQDKSCSNAGLLDRKITELLIHDINYYVNKKMYIKKVINIITKNRKIILTSRPMDYVTYNRKYKNNNDFTNSVYNLDFDQILPLNTINILFTNIADNSNDPSKISEPSMKAKYVQDFIEEKKYIQRLIDNTKYDLIMFQELYTDVIYNNVGVDTINDDIKPGDYNIISDAAMRGAKKYYFDTFYKNYTVIYNKKTLSIDTDYNYNVRLSRLINKKDKNKFISMLDKNNKTYADIELKRMGKRDVKNINFFRLSDTVISENNHNIQHNIFQYKIDNNNLKILVCNIHMVNSYRFPNENLWLGEIVELFETIKLLSNNVDSVLICGDFNSCGCTQLFTFATKYGFNIMGSFDVHKSKSHMYCLFKNIKGPYNMCLQNYKIVNPVHDKCGNHPVIQCEFGFYKTTTININNLDFNIDVLYNKKN